MATEAQGGNEPISLPSRSLAQHHVLGAVEIARAIREDAFPAPPYYAHYCALSVGNS